MSPAIVCLRCTKTVAEHIHGRCPNGGGYLTTRKP